MIILRIFLFLFLFHFSLSSLCTEGYFDEVLINIENKYEVGPEYETCYVYHFGKTRNKLAFVFPKINSTTAEVILYKTKSEISIKYNSYQNYFDRFLISENSLKEVDITEFVDNTIYIIIRDTKYPKLYNYYFILYDDQIAIPLKDGKPTTMKYFFSNNIYRFVYRSSNNLTLVYSSKVKQKKFIEVIYDNDVKIGKQIDFTDTMLYLKTDNHTDKFLYVTIEDIEQSTEDQEFSLIVYEKGINEFIEIKENEIIDLNYINLDERDEIQTFFYYYIIGDSITSNTINFKLDSLAKTTEYIKIVSGSYHSEKELGKDEFEKNFKLDDNRLPLEYDLNSDKYKKIYFQDNDTSYSYRYIYFKIEISKLDKYYSPKTIKISIGEELNILFLDNIKTYDTHSISYNIKAYFPTYFKIKLNPKERYIFTSPYPNNTIYIKGDLLEKDEYQNIIINKNYFVDEDEIFVLSDIEEFTVAIFGSHDFRATFYVEKYLENDLYIIENYRNNDPIEFKFEESDCRNKKKKYLLGIYKKERYSKRNETFPKYWTSNDGEMTSYYRSNIRLEDNSLFPFSDKYKLQKDTYIYIYNYIDFFTFTCSKPGTLTLRSPYKIFNETTYKIGQNTISTLNISNQVEVLQLTSPVIPPAKYLFCAIYSKKGQKIHIFPDYPNLFNETTIEGNKALYLKIDLYQFEPDQLVIKVKSEENTQIEVVEIIRYNFTEYTILKNSKMTRFTDNHFVRFLNKNTKKITVKINGLGDVEVAYGIIKLFTDDVDYLPMAYQFKDLVKKRKLANYETIEIENEYYENNDDSKQFLAFIFSIPSYKYYEFDAQVIQDGDEESNKGIIILIIIGIVVIIALVVVILVIFVKKKDSKKKYEMDVDNVDNSPITKENLFKGFNDNNDN